MSETAAPESKSSSTKDPRKDPGYFVIQIETHDPRLGTLFADKAAKPPSFGTHEVTAAREFNTLSYLKNRSTNYVAEINPDGGLKVTMAVPEFSADLAGQLSAMTHGSDNKNRPLLDSFRYRGSNQDFQRVSIHKGARANVERAGEEVAHLIDLDP